jgi:hypothetical protein
LILISVTFGFSLRGGGWSRVLADTGNIGGELSHEYQVHSEIGEDLLLHCEECLHSANQEKMSSLVGGGGGVVGEEQQVWRGVRSEGTVVYAHISGVKRGREINPLKVQSMLDLKEEPVLLQGGGGGGGGRGRGTASGNHAEEVVSF